MSFIENKDLQECHIAGLQLSLNEFERLTSHDVEFNTDFKWIYNEMRNIYSSYLILNQQNKENAELNFKEQLKIIINPSQFLKERIQNNILEQFKYAKVKYSISSPRELMKSTVFVASLVFYLLLSYIMIFFGFLAKYSITFSFVLHFLYTFFYDFVSLISNFYFTYFKKLFNILFNDKKR